MENYIRNLLLLVSMFIFSYMNVLATVVWIGNKESWNSAVYTLEWKADIFLVDDQWRSSGYKNWHSVEEIPWVAPMVIIGWNNEDRKQIYMSNRQDLTTVIVWKSNESYNLLIAWGNYYLKLEWIDTKKWQIDEIISRENIIEINFDNNKKWKYNLVMDHFKYENWSIYYGSVQSIWDIQKYVIDWNKVNEKKRDSVERSIEKDNTEEMNQYGIITEEDKYKTIEDKKYEKTTNIWIIIWTSCIILFMLWGLYYKNIINRLYIFIIGTIFIVIIWAFLFFGEKQNKIYDCTLAWDEIKEIWKIYDWEWNFEIKSGKVYKKIYQEGLQSFRIVDEYDLKITNIDAASFRIIWYWYTKDSKNIYHNWLKLEWINYCSFELYNFWNKKNLSTWMARDNSNVIFNWKILNNIDVNTFEKVGSDFFKDKDNVFNWYFEVVKTADAKTFIYDNKKYFAYDKNWVYVNNETYIKWADWKSFEKLGGYFYKDKNNVYFKSDIIDWADSESFEEISYEYYKDKNYIYKKWGEILEWLDASSFWYTKLNSIIYDKNWVYPESDIYIKWADWESFVDLWYNYYKDKNNVYYRTKYYKWWRYHYIKNDIEGVNIRDFYVFKRGSWYATDKNKLFFHWELVDEWIDITKCASYYTCSKHYPHK